MLLEALHLSLLTSRPNHRISSRPDLSSFINLLIYLLTIPTHFSVCHTSTKPFMSPHLLSVALVFAWCPAFRRDPSILLKPDTDSMRYSSLCINRPDITVDELHVDTVQNRDKIFEKIVKNVQKLKKYKVEIIGIKRPLVSEQEGAGSV